VYLYAVVLNSYSSRATPLPPTHFLTTGNKISKTSYSIINHRQFYVDSLYFYVINTRRACVCVCCLVWNSSFPPLFVYSCSALRLSRWHHSVHWAGISDGCRSTFCGAERDHFTVDFGIRFESLIVDFTTAHTNGMYMEYYYKYYCVRVGYSI